MSNTPLFSTFLLILIAFSHSTTTTSAQLSPVTPPTAAPPAAATTTTPPPASLPATPPATATPPAATAIAPSPGFSTVPLVPITPGAAPGPAVTVVPKTPTTDIVEILRKGKRFSVLIRLLKTTQLVNQLNSQLATSSGSGGLTVFAPDDSAFAKLKAGFLNSLNDRQKVELLQFHTIATYISISNFDTLTNPVQTQAGDDSKRLQLNVTTYGGSQVSMTTGAVNASITGTVYTDTKLAIYQVDKVLLPLDIVLPQAKAKAPAPGPAAGKGDSPKGDKAKGAGGDVSDGGDDGGDSINGKNVPAGVSSLGYKVEVMWTRVAIGGVLFLAGNMIM